MGVGLKLETAVPESREKLSRAVSEETKPGPESDMEGGRNERPLNVSHAFGSMVVLRKSAMSMRRSRDFGGLGIEEVGVDVWEGMSSDLVEGLRE